MEYKCRLCGISDVKCPGDVCAPCRALLESKNSKIKYDVPDVSVVDEIDPYTRYREEPSPRMPENSAPDFHFDTSNEPDVGIINKSESEQKKSYITKGIVKNIRYNSESQSWVIRWLKSVVTGIPFSVDDYTTLFQVFPDFTGTSTNDSGTVCDQVVIYGKLLRGTLSDNNEVEVYGFRDKKNNIIAESVYNVASGTSIKATGSIIGAYVRLFTLLLIASIVAVVRIVGKERIYQGIADIIVLIIVLVVIWLLVKRFFRRLFR